MTLSRFRVTRRAVLALATAVSLAGPRPAMAAEPLPVVASFSVLGDLVRQVGGDRVTVSVLVGPDGDAHVYQPSASDAKTLAGARAIVVNGLGLEGWFDRLIRASGAKAPVTVASAAVQPIKAEDGQEDGHDHGGFDPHAWQDVANARLYVVAIRDGLSAADPDGRATYEANAGAFLMRLDAVESEVRDAIQKIPADRRKVITTHDAFGYFSHAYGIAFIAPQGVSTEAEASARDVARIVRQIRSEKIPAVFLENVSDPRLMQRIQKETGAKIGGTLFSDALSGPNGPAPTYIDMMRNNIRELSAALAS
jgi:zinc/manganese transport system substrate-binding protein